MKSPTVTCHLALSLKLAAWCLNTDLVRSLRGSGVSSGVLLTVSASIYHDGSRDTGVIVKGYSTGPDTASTIGCTYVQRQRA